MICTAKDQDRRLPVKKMKKGVVQTSRYPEWFDWRLISDIESISLCMQGKEVTLCFTGNGETQGKRGKKAPSRRAQVRERIT